MKPSQKHLAIFTTALVITTLATVFLMCNAYKRLSKAKNEHFTVSQKLKLWETRLQNAQQKLDSNDKAQLFEVAQYMRPTVYLANSKGNPINTNPIPPVRGLQVLATLDSVITKHFPNEFQYQVTKGVLGLQRGARFTEYPCEDGNVKVAEINTRPGDIASFEVKELYRVDAKGKRTLVKPHNTVIRFLLR